MIRRSSVFVAAACFVSALFGALWGSSNWSGASFVSLVESTANAKPPISPASQIESSGQLIEQVPPLPGISPRQFNVEGLTSEETINVAVYDNTNRGVVNILSKTVKQDRFLPLDYSSEGSGSGAVLDTNGNIVTNYHVVEEARDIEVTLFNGKTYEATRVGADPINDLAVIRIDAPEDELFPIRIGDSRRLKVGMRVYALGNPFGLERTLTTGIISSTNRSLQIKNNFSIRGIIQIDAAVNPGSSGGPLLDTHGRLIGINTAIATTSGQSAGVGFAIPASLISRVVPQLIRHGRVIRPEVGITRVYQTEKGLQVAQLRPGGPAEKAGLRGPKTVKTRRGPFVVERIDRSAADLIVGINDEKVITAEDFLVAIESKRPGQEIELVVVRDGHTMSIPITLATAESPK